MATIKQKRAFKEVVNGSTLTNAMKVAKYSATTVKRTNKLTGTKGWQELMDKFIPDKELAKVHQEGLRATRTFSSHTEPDRIEPDYATRHKYLDSGYKLKGKYAPEKVESKNLNVTLDTKSKDLIKKVSKEVIKKLKESE